MGVSKNRGIPKSSTLIGFSFLRHLHLWKLPNDKAINASDCSNTAAGARCCGVRSWVGVVGDVKTAWCQKRRLKNMKLPWKTGIIMVHILLTYINIHNIHCIHIIIVYGTGQQPPRSLSLYIYTIHMWLHVQWKWLIISITAIVPSPKMEGLKPPIRNILKKILLPIGDGNATCCQQS